MNVKDFKKALVDETKAINAKNFKHDIVETKLVPSIDDPDITYPNLATKTQKSKLLTTAVLFVDMRGSTALSMKHQDGKTLAPVYSSFVRAMSKCAHENNGHVRNIIGDRVMVVFDRKDCFKNATQTAIYMNSVVEYVLNKHIDLAEIKAGIGLDFGTMLVTKTGIIKRGDENDPNKALVWLGKPANVASKLTDLANKSTPKTEDSVLEMYHYPYTNQWINNSATVPEFMSHLKSINSRLTHQDEHCYSMVYSRGYSSANPPILMTKYFYENWAKEEPEADSIKKGLWKQQKVSIPGYGNPIMGGNVIKTAMQE